MKGAGAGQNFPEEGSQAGRATKTRGVGAAGSSPVEATAAAAGAGAAAAAAAAAAVAAAPATPPEAREAGGAPEEAAKGKSGAVPPPSEPGALFQTPVGRALRNVNTSNQWSTLTGVLGKVNKKLPPQQRVDARTLAGLLASEPAAELSRNGVWTTSFGARYMPIVCVNRQYARKVAEGGEEGRCSCRHGGGGGDGSGGGTSGPRSSSSTSRFFGSGDYNAGRHALQASAHGLSCLCWAPPTTGHLHSWRRGFD